MTFNADRPLAILSAPGSRGDVNPMVAIGTELKRLGFDVVISLAENYAHVAEAAGLQVEALFSKQEFDAWLGNPNVWTPFFGARIVLLHAAGKFLEPQLEVIRRHHRPGRTVLVSHPLDFASRIFRDLDATTPLVSVQLSPAIVRNSKRPPRLSPWWFEPRKPAWFVKAGYVLADYAIADRFLSPSINQTRRRLGLPKVSRILNRWWLSPDLVLGMYPDWFGDVRPDCDGKWMACGFPLTTHDPLTEASPRTSGVFVTPGTAHQHAKDLFLNVIVACEQIGQQCIVATSYPERLPTTLPSHVTKLGYAALDPLLRSCAAIVHHGGIGTTSMALATGCPQVACPLAFDQFHNADCVTELGVGMECRRQVWEPGATAARVLADVLGKLVDDAETRQHCARFAGRHDSYCGAMVAAKAIASVMPPVAVASDCPSPPAPLL